MTRDQKLGLVLFKGNDKKFIRAPAMLRPFQLGTSHQSRVTATEGPNELTVKRSYQKTPDGSKEAVSWLPPMCNMAPTAIWSSYCTSDTQ